jgi:ceramide glucosyltransferase
LLDNLHLLATIGPGVVAAKRVAGEDVVVGKSMAMRRADLEALGGFETVKDVLAEDYVLGGLVARELGKRVALAARPVENVSQDKRVRDFVDRYRRWAVIHRQSVKLPVYLAEALLQPACFAAAAAAFDRSLGALALLLVAGEIALVAATARRLRPGGLPLLALLAIPLKDALVGLAWVHGLVSRRVEWRGHLLQVLPGTRLSG